MNIATLHIFFCSGVVVSKWLSAVRCRQHHQNSQLIGGDDVNQTIHAVFAALLWHTPVLREDIERYSKFSPIACINMTNKQVW